MSARFARPWVNVFRPAAVSAPWWSATQRQRAEQIFRAPVAAHPVIVLPTMDRLPEAGIPQICVVGRSNVGKSSLINALVHGREIARPSKEPGRTRHLFVFDVGRRLSLVDLPGYGHAKVTRALRQEWAELVDTYLRRSKDLRRVVCLVDAAVGLKGSDLQVWGAVHRAGRRLMVVLTKADRCHAEDLHRNVAEVIAALQPLERGLVWPYVHAVSSEHDLGIRELRASLSAEASAAMDSAEAGVGPPLVRSQQ